MRFLLPAQIRATGLLAFLGDLGRCEDERIEVDFSRLARITPAGLVALTAAVLRWRRLGRAVNFVGLEECRITGYLQRMDLLRVCGVDLPEAFQRREANGRFVPVRPIDHRVDEMGRDMASCAAPGGEDYEHPLSDLYELNARQHSRGTGYAAAQVTPGDGIVRLALADNGKGIRQSFLDAGLAWSADLSESEAIRKSLEPRVSCKGEPTNQGVGLTLVSGLARLTDAWLMIVSGQGVLQLLPGHAPVCSEVPGGGHFAGTLVVLTFRQDRVRAFADTLHEAKVQAGLLHKSRIAPTFES